MGSPDQPSRPMSEPTGLEQHGISEVFSNTPEGAYDEPDPNFLQILKDAGVDDELLLPPHRGSENND